MFSPPKNLFFELMIVSFNLVVSTINVEQLKQMTPNYLNVD